MEHTHEMIVCIVNNGFSEAVMDAAKRPEPAEAQ